MVEGIEVEGCRFAVRAQRDEGLFAAGGNAVDDDVLDAGEGFVGGGLGLGDRLLGCFHPVAEVLRLGDERGLLVLRGLRDLLAVRVLLRAELFEGGDRGAARPVGGERVVDGVGRLAAGLLRALDEVRGVAEQGKIDHAASLVARCGGADAGWLRGRWGTGGGRVVARAVARGAAQVGGSRRGQRSGWQTGQYWMPVTARPTSSEVRRRRVLRAPYSTSFRPAI